MTVSTAPASPKGLLPTTKVPSWIRQGARVSLHSHREICIPVREKFFQFFYLLHPFEGEILKRRLAQISFRAPPF